MLLSTTTALYDRALRGISGTASLTRAVKSVLRCCRVVATKAELCTALAARTSESSWKGPHSQGTGLAWAVGTRASSTSFRRAQKRTSSSTEAPLAHSSCLWPRLWPCPVCDAADCFDWKSAIQAPVPQHASPTSSTRLSFCFDVHKSRVAREGQHLARHFSLLRQLQWYYTVVVSNVRTRLRIQGRL